MQIPPAVVDGNEYAVQLSAVTDRLSKLQTINAREWLIQLEAIIRVVANTADSAYLETLSCRFECQKQFEALNGSVVALKNSVATMTDRSDELAELRHEVTKLRAIVAVQSKQIERLQVDHATV